MDLLPPPIPQSRDEPTSSKEGNFSSHKKNYKKANTILFILGGLLLSFSTLVILLAAGTLIFQTLGLSFKGLHTNSEVSASQIFQAYSPSIVKIYSLRDSERGSKTGTGFVVSLGKGKPWIMTNAHVTAKASILVIESQDNIWIARHWKENLNVDASLIELEDSMIKNLPALPLNISRNITPGEKTYTLGHPLGGTISIHEGIVSGHEKDRIIFSAPFSEGASGSPLINRKGEVIGLCSSYMPDAQNYNIAVKASSFLYQTRWKAQSGSIDPELEKFVQNLRILKKEGGEGDQETQDEISRLLAPEEPLRTWYGQTKESRNLLFEKCKALVEAEKRIDWKTLGSKTAKKNKAALLAFQKAIKELDFAWNHHIEDSKDKGYSSLGKEETEKKLSATIAYIEPMQLFFDSASQLCDAALSLTKKAEMGDKFVTPKDRNIFRQALQNYIKSGDALQELYMDQRYSD